MKNKTIFVLLFLFHIIISLHAQNANILFYYYKDSKVHLEENHHYFLLCYDNTILHTELLAEHHCTIEEIIEEYNSTTKSQIAKIKCTDNKYEEIRKWLIQNEAVMWIEKAVGEDKAPTFFLNTFYIQLHNSSDKDKLKKIADSIGATIEREIPNTENWIALRPQDKSRGTSLELANKIWETGQFRNVDPGFLLPISEASICVSDSAYANKQWNLEHINACEAWNITKGNPSVKVAVIDRGMCKTHTEFQQLDTSLSYDLMTYSSPSKNYNDGMPAWIKDCHGTHVAGIIFSDHNHAQIAGIAPDVTPIDISHKLHYGTNYLEKLISGIYWAVSHNAKVINCSWYIKFNDTIVQSAMLNGAINFANENRCLLVFSSGNDGDTTVNSPVGDFPNVLIVGSSDTNDKRVYDSNHGDKLDVVAPGDPIYSTYGRHNHDYYTMGGTSMAAPHVSGLAALIYSINPDLEAVQVASIIKTTAQKVNPSIYQYCTSDKHDCGTWNNQMGYGLIDANKALQVASDYCGNDLMIRDYPTDDGTTPSNAPTMWDSPDIWVEKADNPGIPTNPSVSDECNVCVRIFNHSDVASSGKEWLSLNWAKAGCDLRWNSSWYGTTFFDCGDNPQKGDWFATKIPIPSIPAHSSIVVKYPWYVIPDPADYALCTQFESERWHFCIVARIHDDFPIFGENDENTDMWYFVSRNNNVAWKNISILDAEENSAVVTISNPFETPQKIRLHFKTAPKNPNSIIIKNADVYIKLDNQLKELWEKGGSKCIGGKNMGDGRILVTNPELTINELKLPPKQHYTFKTNVQFYTQSTSHSEEFDFDIYEEYDKGIIGGEHYIARKNSSKKFKAIAHENKTTLAGEETTFTASDIHEDAHYHWFSMSGDTLSKEMTLTTVQNNTQSYVLEVISPIDEYKDRDTVIAYVKLSTITKISPNPAINQALVEYRLASEVNNATIILFNQTGQSVYTSYLSNTSTSHIIPLQGIPIG